MKTVTSLSTVPVLIAVSSLLLFGCAGDFPTKHYVATATWARRAPANTTDDVRQVSADAPRHLKNGAATVAFFPPDRCVTTSATAPGTTTVAGYIQVDCGVLMSALEMAAATEGYSVVDWNQLKGPPSPRQHAIDQKVDVLFVVDELSVNARRPDQYSTITFSQQISPQERAPVSLPDVTLVGDRCKQQLTAPGGNSAIESATLALKMVSVVDGHAQWFYRRTVVPREQPPVTRDLFFSAAPVKKSGRGLIIAGAVLTAVGATALGLGISMVKDSSPGSGIQITGDILAPVGGAAILSSIIVTVVGSVRETRDPVYSLPEEVLCVGRGSTTSPLTASRELPRPQETVSPPSGSTFAVAEAVPGDHDASRELREALIHAVVTDFISELRSLRSVR